MINSEHRAVGRPKKEQRRRQKGVHGRGRKKLSVPEIKGYYCRWANDVGTNMHDMTRLDDYDYATRGDIGDHVGESTSDGNSDLGDKVRVLVDKDEQGKPIYSYLMKKPIDFHKDDVAAAESSRQEKEAVLRRGHDDTGAPIGEQYGQIR